jgi:hypothetical protein
MSPAPQFPRHVRASRWRSSDAVAWPKKDLPPKLRPDRIFEAAAFALDDCGRNALAGHHLGLLPQGGGKKLLGGLVRKAHQPVGIARHEAPTSDLWKRNDFGRHVSLSASRSSASRDAITLSDGILKSRCTQTQTPTTQVRPRERRERQRPDQFGASRGRNRSQFSRSPRRRERGGGGPQPRRPVPSLIREPRPMRRAAKIVHPSLSAGGGVDGVCRAISSHRSISGNAPVRQRICASGPLLGGRRIEIRTQTLTRRSGCGLDR